MHKRKHWLALGTMTVGWMAMAGPAWAAGPTITGLKDQTTIAVFGIVGPVLFTVGDDATPADALTVTATSSDQNILVDDDIVLGGSGATRSLTILRRIKPEGQATVTVSVSDGTDDHQQRHRHLRANQTTATVTITPRADMQAEGPESVQIHILPNRAYFVTSGVAIITIADAP